MHEIRSDEQTIRPVQILKTCRHDFKEYYKVKWSKLDDKYNTFNDQDLSQLEFYETLEVPELFKIYYSSLVDDFNDRISMKKTKKSIIQFQTRSFLNILF